MDILYVCVCVYVEKRIEHQNKYLLHSVYVCVSINVLLCVCQ